MLVSVCLACLTSCRREQPGTAASPSIALKIDRLEPSFTVAGKVFNAQPDGGAAMAVVGEQLPAGSVVLWNNQPLKTGGGGAQGWLAASVPSQLYQDPGTAQIVVRSPDGKATSNTLEFRIYPQTGPAPTISDLYPPRAEAGKGFNVQPNGNSALGVNGSGFLPGAVIFWGGKQMPTSFRSAAYVSAAIPKTPATQAGAVEVWVVNPHGAASNKVAFKISK